MKVSVIIPCFNRQDSIRGAVLSVLNQLGDHTIEVIVVDDGSTDASMEVIKDLDVKTLKTSGRTGACNARNIGIKEAINEFVAFNDSDDFWMPDKLDCIEKCLNEFEVEYLFHSFIRVRGDKSFQGGEYSRKSVLIKPEDILKKILIDNQISTQCLLAKKYMLMDIGGFDTNLGRFQDWELAIRVCEKYKGFYIAKPLALCIESIDSISKSKAKGVSARKYILQKHERLYKKNPIQMAYFKFQLIIRNIIFKL